jgi:hypothetical protein
MKVKLKESINLLLMKTSRLILLVFVSERCGTHDLNFNKDGMLHKKVHFHKYFKLFLAIFSTFW